MTRIEEEGRAARLEMARDRVLRLLSTTADEPVEIGVIGSLATGRFGLHSDIDLLVRGEIDTATRVRLEQKVAAALRGSGLPYDLIFASDLSPERLLEFEHDFVEPSRLREAWAKAGAHP